MGEIQLGKKLCGQLFETLRNRADIDQKVAIPLQRLYSADKLMGENIPDGLSVLRAEREDEPESQT